jgi:uncharacterized membrane protein
MLAPHQQATAYDINDHGDVVGWGFFGSVDAAFHYDSATNTTTLLPALTRPGASNNAYAWAINDDGLTVGYSGYGSAEIVATLWDTNGTPIDLTTLLDASGAGWTLAEARDINDLGQIVGWGKYDPDGFGPIPATNGAMLLTPIPEPASLAAAVALVALTLHRRRAPAVGMQT